ncbi:hypothetical protein OG879_31450 [Streptomyces caniferus]|uniref:hypothetical protein n=1 Tax=Streptomyces caniferus TaxID=285557 RepID=UPI002E29DE64|nr:hypothetical protein [Streptomyces caniferus]
MLETLRAIVRDNPVKVRAAIAAVLVLVGQLIPSIADVVGSDTIVDVLTGVVVVVLGADAARKVTQK